MKNEFKQYKRKGLSEMRQVVFGEDLTNVSISEPDKKLMQEFPNVFSQGYIARNPKNHADMWYVAKKYFDDNLELADYLQPIEKIEDKTERSAEEILKPYVHHGSILVDYVTPDEAIKAMHEYHDQCVNN